MAITIPSISLSQLEPTETNRPFQEACTDWGIFRLTEHNVSDSIRDSLLEEMAGFFALPSTNKKQIERTDENPWGFYDRELTKNRRDWKEIFDVGPEEGLHRPQWPEGRSAFRRAAEAYYQAAESISQRLIRTLARSLGAAPDSLDGAFVKHTSFLRLNAYPPCAEPAESSGPTTPEKGELGISHHTDAGALTVLLHDGKPGLQIEKAGIWYDLEGRRGDLIINLGDVAQVWSNDRYRAPVHRVVAHKHNHRFSAPFFFNPSNSAFYAPLAEACQDAPPRYRAISWSQFQAQRAAGDYADRGEEVQISHYEI